MVSKGPSVTRCGYREPERWLFDKDQEGLSPMSLEKQGYGKQVASEAGKGKETGSPL